MGKNVTPLGRVWSECERASRLPPLSARPVWTSWVRKISGTGSEIEVGPRQEAARRCIGIAQEGGARGLVAAVDGTRTIEQLCAFANVELVQGGSLVAELYAAGALALDCQEPVDAPLFCQHVVSLARDLIMDHGASPVLAPMAEGKASRRLALGYLLDVYHFALSAPSHIASAISVSTSERMRLMYSEFLSEEYWHFAWMKKGLLAAGISEQELDGSEPTPGAMSLINYLRWLSATDPLAYALCLAMGEGSPERLPERRAFWDRFASHNILPEAVWLPFREHELLDYAEGHAEFGLEPFREAGALAARDRERIEKRVLYYARLIPLAEQVIAREYGVTVGASYFDPRAAVTA